MLKYHLRIEAVLGVPKGTLWWFSRKTHKSQNNQQMEKVQRMKSEGNQVYASKSIFQ